MLNNTIALFGTSAAAAANSFDSIATVTVGAGGSSSITFSSIPNTYTHLQIRGIAKSAATGTVGGQEIYVQFNSDTANNYSWHQIQGNGTTVTSVAGASTNVMDLGTMPRTGTYSTNMFSTIIIDILDYANTNKYKTVRALGGQDTNSTSGYVRYHSGSWRNTNAVTSITITDESSLNFVQYSTFALYGIKG